LGSLPPVAQNSGGPAAGSGRALVDGWYRWFLPEHRSLGEVVNRWPKRLRPLVWRLGPVRALTLLVAGRNHCAIVTIRRDPGWRSLLLLSALCQRRPKLVVLHFIDHPLRRSGLRGRLDQLWRPLERWCLRRTLLRGHVLSAWEVELYSQRYEIEQARLAYVPFAWRQAPAGSPAAFRAAAERSGVIAAGRVACDWATLFRAARDQEWTLTVVCPASDRTEVDGLNGDVRALVRSDLSAEETQKLLASCAVSVIAMYETGISQGHVRLRSAVDSGVPVVASHTKSMDGYVENGRTALLVAPGDPGALREAVNELLAYPTARDEIARAAWERAEAWTWENYLAAISALAQGEPARAPQAADSGEPGRVPQAASCTGGESEPSLREITLDTPSDPMDTP
jgi:glycosyltransferase involved in cell wall biosynthesis